MVGSYITYGIYGIWHMVCEVPLTTETIIFVGSDNKILSRNFRWSTRKMGFG